MIGGGLVGGECALFLSSHGNDITIFEFLPDVIMKEPGSIRRFVLRDYKDAGVKINVNTKVMSINDDKTITYENENGVQTSAPFDEIIIGTGMKGVNTLEAALADSGIEVLSIGDAKQPGDGNAAIRDGYVTALGL